MTTPTANYLTATYSPEDNKLRMYATSRLEADLYARIKAAGFIWAPRQELFVAPAWTPARADLLMELCGDIGDEDTSLSARAEDRAERFEGYSDNRAEDSGRAAAAAEQIAGRFEFGQPILIGHHSEKRARKDKERIEGSMRKAVQMWETASYWTYRAAGALQHAKYKELPGVRYRRIKTLEAEARKHQRTIDEATKALKYWQTYGLTFTQAQALADRFYSSRCFTLAEYPRNPPATQYEGAMSYYSALTDGVITLEQVKVLAINAQTKTLAWAQRWLDHYKNRIAYERAMLGEQGGLKAEGFDIQPGGRVLIGNEWVVVVRVNKKAGVIVSLTTSSRFVPVKGIEEVKGYTAPTEEMAAAAKSVTKLAPLTNFPGEGFYEMTAAQWKDIYADHKGTRVVEASATNAKYRHRVAYQRGHYPQVYITDSKRVDPPAPTGDGLKDGAIAQRVYEVAEPLQAGDIKPTDDAKQAAALQIEAIKDQLKSGVQVVQAEQLFATPEPLADYVVEVAEIERGHSVLEPSAGTGRLLKAIRKALGGGAVRTAIEINSRLCDRLRIVEAGAEVFNRDFLQCHNLGKFDRIVMNPPFVNGQDIAHILHALPMLKPRGRLVALCANGPRQNEKLRPLIEQHGGSWEVLPAKSFEQSGTLVSVAMLVLNASR